jgi:hypothetical protein
MPEYLTNRLSFLSNSSQILNYLRSPCREDCPTPLFSLDAIRSTPASLKLTIDSHVRRLSLLNSDLSGLDEAQKELIWGNLGDGCQSLSSQARIEAVIKEFRSSIGDKASTGPQTETNASNPTPSQCLENAISNYRQSGFFSYIDWRLAHWGTVHDVCSVVEDTFIQPTNYIEFQTRWSAPVTAMQYLANTFPSVRFELLYRFENEDPWTKVELFPTVPFGY